MSAAPSLRPVLVLQLVFMLGFSSVVPFFAAIGQSRFGLDAAAVGALVGARVIAQQGLFVAGGYLTDRFGPRLLLVAGCLLRALAFGVIAWAPDAPAFVAGVVLVGLAGALFSPAIDALVGRIDAERRSLRGTATSRGPAPFAALALAGETGGIIASLGAARFMPDHSAVLAAISAAVFLGAAAAVHRLVPRGDVVGPRVPSERTGGPVAVAPGGPAAADPAPVDTTPAAPAPVDPVRVVPLAIACSALLAVYTQLFSTVPLALAEHGIDAGRMGAVAAALSAATLALQWPLSRLAERLGRCTAVMLALYVSAAACATAFAGQLFLPPAALPGMFCAVAVLVGVSLMLGTPNAQSLIAGGSSRWRATRLAFLPTAGGIVAFLTTTATGAVAGASGTLAAWPLAAALPAAMLPVAWYALRPAHELIHHSNCPPATAGSTLEKERTS
ncbi:MFS transporter [Zhihengliuella halotolerans]|uniref:MFS transporter n=1 Tax=Zhihengliuella halotolerans TaxID=370736 RepID=A0A4Q8AEG5_9MICC|nr:MFS transporter [Zhihengliuella halotolerans]RZU62662.1 MFS transporter [Zhihengliuella halotolerans]